jgi:hypothetical protein
VNTKVRRNIMFPQPRHVFLDDTGTVTIEQALSIITAAALAGLLFAIVTGGSVRDGLANLVEHALNFTG